MAIRSRIVGYSEINGESVRELAVQQRFLTEDEISDARAMVGWQFWAAPAIFGFAGLGLGIGAIGGNPVIIFAFLLVFSAAFLLCLSRVRDFKKVSHDIEMRVVEVIEGAPEKVWAQRDGFCYLLLAGRTIRVPPDLHVYESLREANTVKIAFRPRRYWQCTWNPIAGLAYSRLSPFHQVTAGQRPQTPVLDSYAGKCHHAGAEGPHIR